MPLPSCDVAALFVVAVFAAQRFQSKTFALLVLVCLQIALYHALDLAPMNLSDIVSGPVPLDTRRAVLLVPKLGLNLLREFTLPGVYMSVTAATGAPIPVRKRNCGSFLRRSPFLSLRSSLSVLLSWRSVATVFGKK